MEDQDPRKNHASGLGLALGVHHCQKCGWPFPNPHPSARHRRAHKRVCGTIQGYNPVSTTTTATTGSHGDGVPSDDDHLSNEDHKTRITTIPKAVQACNEKNIGGIGAVSSRSDDDVFSDAATEFLENSSTNLSPYQSFKDCANTDIIQSPESTSFKHVGEASEQTSKSEKSVEITDLTDGVVQLENDISQGFKISTNMHIGQETDAVTKSGVGAEKSLMDDVISQSKHANVTRDAELEVEATSHIEPTVELSKHIIALDTAQIKVDATQTTNFQDSNEDYGKEGLKVELEDELSASNDIPLVKPAEIDLLKDHKMIDLHQPGPLASDGTISERENEVQDSNSEWRESVDVSPSGMHLAGDSSKREDCNGKPMSEEPVIEEDVLQVNVESNKVGVSATTENDKDPKGCSVEKHQLEDTCDDFSQAGYSGTETRAFSDVQSCVVAPNGNEVDQIVSTCAATAQEKSEIGLCGIAGIEDDDMKCCTGSMIPSFEPASSLSNSHVTPGSGLLEDDNAGHIGREETESFDITEVHSGESLSQENLSTNAANSMSDLINNHQESQVFVEHVNDDSQERDCKDVDQVSKILEDVKVHQVIDTGNEQGDCTAQVVADESENGVVPNFWQTLEDNTMTEHLAEGQMKKDSPSFPEDVEPIIQNLAPVENNNIMVVGRASSGVGSCSLHKDAGTSSAKQQLDTTATDVESTSLTDSMEGDWGSISDTAVSIPSEIPTGIDTEAEKVLLKKPDGASDLDKSDIFEPPSFMTLVEPGGGGDQAAAADHDDASAMQAAGWFPSLTHAPNESQGRKRNEEIIAKVTNWNVVKTPNPVSGTLLKGEEKAFSPPMKVSSILGHEATTGKEWDSPARYPAANIKREKKKVKGKRNWVQFVCCSSVY